jgi:uncharacterized protein YbjT (DUF2867 family)
MTNKERLILVTGATGKQGTAVVDHLRARGFPIRALTRDPEKPAARNLVNEGVEVAAGDFNDPDSLRRAMDGVYGVFSMSTPYEEGSEAEIRQGKILADAASRSQVTHYIYTSVGGAERKTGVPHFDSKFEIEEHVRGLGFPHYTIIRPVFFMENWLVLKGMIDAGKIYWPLSPQTKLQQVATSDIGGLAAMAFEHRDHWQGRAVELAGDDRTMTDMVAAFSRKIVHEVTYQQVPWDQYEQTAGPEWAIMFRWFEDHGYEANIEALRSEYPQLTNLDQWLNRQDWQAG